MEGLDDGGVRSTCSMEFTEQIFTEELFLLHLICFAKLLKLSLVIHVLKKMSIKAFCYGPYWLSRNFYSY